MHGLSPIVTTLPSQSYIISFCSRQTPQSAQYFITVCIQQPVCVCVRVCVCVLHVCRLVINLHANSHYEPHLCPAALKQTAF